MTGVLRGECAMSVRREGTKGGYDDRNDGGVGTGAVAHALTRRHPTRPHTHALFALSRTLKATSSGPMNGGE